MDIEKILVLIGLIILFIFVCWVFSTNGQIAIYEYFNLSIPDEKWLP